MLRNYYNELDPYAAQWLRNLIQAKLIPQGDVDTRDIRDVRPSELNAYTQCHFFAGIGGWSYALQIANFPTDRKVWTGSCPCQPFSAAGKRRGFADERHLWPYWFHLIEQCRPAIVFGEQVSSAPVWLDGVYVDLERANFAVGAADLPAASVGAKHKRYRIWFVAHAFSSELRNESRWREADGKSSSVIANNGANGHVADAAQLTEREQAKENNAVADGWRARIKFSSVRKSLADANSKSKKRLAIPRPQYDPWGAEPDVGRVLDGVSHKLVEGALRGFGNSIVPQVAAEFIKAAMECLPVDKPTTP